MFRNKLLEEDWLRLIWSVGHLRIRFEFAPSCIHLKMLNGEMLSTLMDLDLIWELQIGEKMCGKDRLEYYAHCHFFFPRVDWSTDIVCGEILFTRTWAYDYQWWFNNWLTLCGSDSIGTMLWHLHHS